MHDQQTQLLDFLRYKPPTPSAEAILKRTAQQFILDYGWWYEPAELPHDMAVGTMGRCLVNAAQLMLDDSSLVYCEGFAQFSDQSVPVVHAWVTDGRGRAIDNTWPRPGAAYAGVPFKSSFVSMTSLKNRAIVSVIDDFLNGDPFRGGLFQRPEELLELRGRGAIRIDGSNVSG